MNDDTRRLCVRSARLARLERMEAPSSLIRREVAMVQQAIAQVAMRITDYGEAVPA